MRARVAPVPDVTRREWDAEVELDVGAAAALVAAQFPHLAPAPVELLAAGWDNTVFQVGTEWAFRFPRRSAAIAGVARERSVLPRLAPRVPLAGAGAGAGAGAVPVPVPVLVGRPAGPGLPLALLRSAAHPRS